MNPFLRCACGLMLAAASTCPAVAAEFRFGSSSGHNLTGMASATIADGGLGLTLQATAPGAVLAEIGSGGLGVNSRAIAGVADGSTDKFDLLGGTSTLAGAGEQISFSFDRAGVLHDLDFDGVKDEDYEFFLLQTTTSADLYFFDSFNGSNADAGLISVPGEVRFLQEAPGGGGSGPLDDRTFPLRIPFSAGQAFTLTYGQLGAGNGARLQGITAYAVPAPCSAVLLLIGTGGLLPLNRVRRRAA